MPVQGLYPPFMIDAASGSGTTLNVICPLTVTHEEVRDAGTAEYEAVTSYGAVFDPIMAMADVTYEPVTPYTATYSQVRSAGNATYEPVTPYIATLETVTVEGSFPVTAVTDSAGRLSVDLTVVRGDNYTQRFTLKDSAGVLVDVTGLSAKLSVNTDATPTDETDQLFEITGVPAGTPADGYFDFTPDAAQALQTPDTYFYDVQITDGSGNKFTIAAGKWIVVADITDAGT